MARVVGEAHLHLEGFALVVGRRRVGGSHRALNVSVGVPAVGHPLVAERRAAQAVGVGDAGSVRPQRPAHLRRAADGGQTRGRRVDRHRDSVAHPRRELADLQGERSARNNPEAGVWVEVAIAQVLVGAGSWTVFAEVMRTHVVQGERDRSSDLVLPHADLIAVDAAGLYGDR